VGNAEVKRNKTTICKQCSAVVGSRAAALTMWIAKTSALQNTDEMRGETMVRLFVGVTDKAWFDQLSASVPHDEVNFWQPSGTTQFRALQPGELFLFKLHAPNNFIVGGGIFGHASIAPLSLAWEAFGLKNGGDDGYTAGNVRDDEFSDGTAVGIANGFGMTHAR